MDELELLKKDWQSGISHDEPKLSDKEIYPMIHKKSSSIVKTLFYISVAELIFWIILNAVPYVSSETYRTDAEAMFGGSTNVLIITVLSIAIVILFVYLLYRSYKSISVTDSAKHLMESILKTRKIIKYYVIYNLVAIFLSMSFGMYYTIYENPEVSQKFAEFSDKQMFFAMLFIVIATALFVLAFWVFYRIIYGILLKRLNRNYKELKKLEV